MAPAFPIDPQISANLRQFRCDSEDGFALPEPAKSHPVAFEHFAPSSIPSTSSRDTRYECWDDKCCHELPQKSLAICTPLMPILDQNCLTSTGEHGCKDSCDNACSDRCDEGRIQWYARWLRSSGVPSWLSFACCEEKQMSGPQQAIKLRNLVADASLEHAERSGGIKENYKAAQKPKRQFLVQEPAIPLPVPESMAEKMQRAVPMPESGIHQAVLEVGEFQEEAEREYTEVELESDAVNYRGQWLGRSKHGEGMLAFSDGRSYEGQFVHDLADGHGKLTLASGAMLEANWVKGKADGFGRYSHRGNTYEGQWKADEKNGKGTEVWPDGSCYVGDFTANLRHGIGRYKTAAGAVYEGHFAEDKMHGFGRYTFVDGHTYQGEWVCGHQCGQGQIEWKNGFRYEGSLKNDKKDGLGLASWPNGKTYYGEWASGLQHGKGVTTDPAGVKEERQWHYGRLVPEVSRRAKSPRSRRPGPSPRSNATAPASLTSRCPGPSPRSNATAPASTKA